MTRLNRSIYLIVELAVDSALSIPSSSSQATQSTTHQQLRSRCATSLLVYAKAKKGQLSGIVRLDGKMCLTNYSRNIFQVSIQQGRVIQKLVAHTLLHNNITFVFNPFIADVDVNEKEQTSNP